MKVANHLPWFRRGHLLSSQEPGTLLIQYTRLLFVTRRQVVSNSFFWPILQVVSGFKRRESLMVMDDVSTASSYDQNDWGENIQINWGENEPCLTKLRVEGLKRDRRRMLKCVQISSADG